MSTIRTFIAIELTDEAHIALTDLQYRLKAITPPKTVRWTAPENIHLTLHFLGDVAGKDIGRVKAALETAALACRPFTLTLTGLGCFPNLRRPRIVWAGIAGETGRLGELHRDLGEKLKVIDFQPETRPYSPHLTIGRVKKVPPRHLSQLSAVLEKEQPKVETLATWPVQAVSLFSSDLKPAGPVYTRLARAELTNG